jgi:glycosyltransferase involved in cell wall biosynthesis
VIPNKVYQILATGRPLITADTPAIRELLSPDRNIRLIAPGDPDVLASEVADVADGVGFHTKEASRVLPVGPSDVGKQLVEVLEQFT